MASDFAPSNMSTPIATYRYKRFDSREFTLYPDSFSLDEEAQAAGSRRSQEGAR
jgi:hypothetical protein